MNNIQFTINMIPVAKGRARTRVVGGKYAIHYTPQKTRAAENDILAQAIAFKPEAPFHTQAEIELVFHMPVPKSMPQYARSVAGGNVLPHNKKPDLDNLTKAVLDALNGVFFRDDSIIHSLKLSKIYGSTPKIEVRITGR